MSAALRSTFQRCRAENRNALVTFVTAGYPTLEDTVEILLSMQKGGVDVIELGIPFLDPIADGPTIQVANVVLLSNGTTLPKCLELVAAARAAGLTVPVVLMGYYNPILIYGEERMLADAAKAGANGFIVVDLPPEEAVKFRGFCAKQELLYIPLVAPLTTDDRLALMALIADLFIYVVLRMGTTGASGTLSSGIAELCSRVRAHSGDTPLAVGFGVSTREHFLAVGASADGVVIGSKIITLLGESKSGERGAVAEAYVKLIVNGGSAHDASAPVPNPTATPAAPAPSGDLPQRFGDFGGQYVPEAMHACLQELERGFEDAVADPAFWKEYKDLYPYIGRPLLFHRADRLSEHCGTNIWLKREDLNHTGLHKINNALAQVLLAKRLGKQRVIAETGAGQHGVATATACAKFGLPCTVFMGAEDVRRQALNVFRMKLLGAEVVAVTNGTQTLRDATSEAFRFWVLNLDTTHYVVGSAIGPHPYPTLVRTFQQVIGDETKEQFGALNNGALPDLVVACVGGGLNLSGMFKAFEKDALVRLLGVEAGGDGVDTERHSATLTAGKPGVFHGVRTYLLQDGDGQVHDTHSVLAGLDYPGVGPELAFWKASGRAEFVAATDANALEGFRLLLQLEGIIPALELSHAVYGAVQAAKEMTADQHVVITISGRGDKDVQLVAEVLPKLGPQIGWDLRFEQMK